MQMNFDQNFHYRIFINFQKANMVKFMVNVQKRLKGASVFLNAVRQRRRHWMQLLLCLFWFQWHWEPQHVCTFLPTSTFNRNSGCHQLHQSFTNIQRVKIIWGQFCVIFIYYLFYLCDIHLGLKFASNLSLATFWLSSLTKQSLSRFRVLKKNRALNFYNSSWTLIFTCAKVGRKGT